jgi:hypothetical protein
MKIVVQSLNTYTIEDHNQSNLADL